MPIINEPFDQLKIDRLRHYLEDMVNKEQPKPYEIFVDSLKVVPKTENPKDFDSYEFYMNEDTEKIRIVIYNTTLSPRNDQYIFVVQNKPSAKGLNGVSDVEALVQKGIAERNKEIAFEQLQKELTDTKQRLTEAEEYIEDLQNQVELSKSNKYKLGNVNLVELAASGLETMLRKNTNLIAKIPVAGEALAGMFGGDTTENNAVKEPTPPINEGDASFIKKAVTPNELSQQQGYFIQLVDKLKTRFNEEQLVEIFQILQKIYDDPTQLEAIKQLVKL